MHAITFFLNVAWGVSADCPNLRTLAVSLQINSVQTGIYSQLLTDCCLASGITCDGNSRVTNIVWNGLNLGGTIDGPSLFGLSSLFRLTLNDNHLTGRLPALPTSLVQLEVHGNVLSGDLPTFPISLTSIYLGMSPSLSNMFTGKLSAYRPYNLQIFGNFINDIVITDSSVLSGCDISYNLLLGNQGINNLGICTKNNLAAYVPPVVTTTITAGKSTTSKSTSTLLKTQRTGAISSSLTTTLFKTSTTTLAILMAVTGSTTSIGKDFTSTISLDSSKLRSHSYNSQNISEQKTNIFTHIKHTPSIPTTFLDNDMPGSLPQISLNLKYLTGPTYTASESAYIVVSTTSTNVLSTLQHSSRTSLKSVQNKKTVKASGSVVVLTTDNLNDLISSLNYRQFLKVLFDAMILGTVVAKLPSKVSRKKKSKFSAKFSDTNSARYH